MILTACSPSKKGKNNVANSSEEVHLIEGSTVKEISSTESKPKESSAEISGEESTEKQEETEPSAAELSMNDLEIQTFLKEFGEKFVNYKSIDERNGAVKGLLTEDCAKENGMTVKVNADFTAQGEVLQIYRPFEDDKSQSYIIVGKERSSAGEQGILLTVSLREENAALRISKLTVHYVKQAY
ncbi:hypothetical protein RV18_GL002455 [Enterococcus termitis]|nr:hypothetical protein RV18_GL002455 [Enterococcus termitis]